MSLSLLQVERYLIMAVSPNSVFSNVFKAFYDVLNSKIADPVPNTRQADQSAQWIYSSYPEADLDENRIHLPLMIIEPADISTLPFTQIKKRGTVDVAIKCYDTRLERADSILNKVFAVLDDNIWYFKNQQGLHFMQLTGTATDWYYQGGTRVHVRSANYSMQYFYNSGLGKLQSMKLIRSNARIA